MSVCGVLKMTLQQLRHWGKTRFESDRWNDRFAHRPASCLSVFWLPWKRCVETPQRVMVMSLRSVDWETMTDTRTHAHRQMNGKLQPVSLCLSLSFPAFKRTLFNFPLCQTLRWCFRPAAWLRISAGFSPTDNIIWAEKVRMSYFDLSLNPASLFIVNSPAVGSELCWVTVYTTDTMLYS